MVEKAGTCDMGVTTQAEPEQTKDQFASIALSISMVEYNALITLFAATDARTGQWYAGAWRDNDQEGMANIVDEIWESDIDECQNMYTLLSDALGVTRKLAARFETASNRMNAERGSAYRRFE